MTDHRTGSISTPETAPGIHPRGERLASFALGRLAEPEWTQVAEHLEACESCRVAVETVPGDHLVRLVRESLGKVPVPPRLRVHPGYEVLEQIGRGGMGVVYKARQLGLGRIVALKLLRQGQPQSPEELARFLAEAGAMGRLAHPNFVQVYEVGEQDGQPYIACEFVAGGSLDRHLSGKPLPFRAACQLVSTLAKAVHVAHEQSVIHRDLKPSNVLLSSGPTATIPAEDEAYWRAVIPKITDFGLAKHLDRAHGVTRTGEIIGTPEYMAPELASGQANDAGPEADVYSLGVILYELLTGRRPFQGGTVTETLDLVRNSEPVPPQRWLPRLPRNLEVVCLKCLEKAPGRRYPTAALLADDLDRVLDGRPILARAPTPVERIWKWVGRNPLWAALILLGTLSAAGLAGGVSWHVRRLGIEVRRASIAESSALGKVREGYDALDQLIQEMVRDHPETATWSERDAHVKEKALDFYYRVLDGADDANPRVRLTRGLLLVYAGSIHVTLFRNERAVTDLEAARQLLEPLISFPELCNEAQDYLANCEYNLGLAEFRCGRAVAGEQLLKRSIGRLESLAEQGIAIPRLEHRLALRHEQLSEFAFADGRVELATSELETAIHLRARAASNSPQDIPNCLQLIDDYLRDSFRPGIDRRIAQATDEIDQAEEVLRDRPEIAATLSGRKALIRISAHRAVIAVVAGRIEDALAHHDRGIEVGLQTLEREPNDLRTRAELFSLYRAKAYTLCRNGRAEESFPFWEQALRIVEPRGRGFCRAEIALERALLGDHVRAAAEAAEIGRAVEISEDTLLYLARIYSRSIEAVEREPGHSEAPIAEYTAAGMNALCRIESWLRSHLSRLAELESDPAFARLRDTASFQEWRASEFAP